MTEPSCELRVTALRWEAEGVISVELRDPAGQPLPPFSPGAHIDLHLPGGLIRQYSLCNAPSERQRYLLAVSLDPVSRGGSRHIHERLRVGQRLRVDGPRNHFPLATQAAEHILIAGGIGITPLLSMYRQLSAEARPCRLYYAVREASRAAFAEEIAALGGDFKLHLDATAGGPLDLAAIIAAHPTADFYCCGPGPMLQAFERATATLAPERVHMEYFAPRHAASPVAEETAFEVECRASGRTVHVPAGQSVAEALIAAGIAVPTACQEGICGTCETRVLAGEPLHRDSVLSPAERAAGHSMMLCVSRCRGRQLVLDL